MLSEEEKLLICDLISAGEGLEDAAETCGHTESLEEWEEFKAKGIKLIGGSAEFGAILQRAVTKRREEGNKKKEKLDKEADSKVLSEEEFWNS